MKKTWIDNKTFVLTGASSGIGRLLAEMLIERNGCRIFGIGRNEERLSETKERLGEKSALFIPICFDVSDEREWLRFADNLGGEKIDGIISCAGILPKFQRAESTPPDTVRKVMGIHYFSFVYAYSALRQNLNERYSLVTVSSLAALATFPGTGAYSASKAAIKSYMEAVAAEGDGNVYTCLIMPGFVRTNIFRNQNTGIDENGLIKFFSMAPGKMANKIYAGLLKRKRRMILGIDAKLMSILYTVSSSLEAGLMNGVIKAAHLPLFEDVFD